MTVHRKGSDGHIWEDITMKDSKIRRIVLAAMMAALSCVATMSIRIPTIGTNGYVNAGDAVVLLSAWLIGGPYGAIAAGGGTALADLLSGYSHYVPATFIIKFTMAFVASALASFMINKRVPKTAAYITSAVAAELIMICGYFTYQFFILGYGIAAASSIGGNIAQGITCSVIAMAIFGALQAAKVPARLFAGQH